MNIVSISKSVVMLGCLLILALGFFSTPSAQASSLDEIQKNLTQLQLLLNQYQKSLGGVVKGVATSTDTVIPTGQTITTQSVTQYGITWNFAQPQTVGKFANGDYWVLGPVTITQITPDFTGTRNGWEVNPVNGNRSQGYDNRGFNFSASRVPTLPYTAQGGASIIKTVSTIPGSGGCADSNNPCYLLTAAVLTVVSSIPAGNGADFFRPPYVGTEKPLYKVSTMRTDLLPSLPAIAGGPTLADVESDFKRVQLDHITSWTTSYLHPAQNIPQYGSTLALRNNEGAMRLMENDPLPTKMPALIAFVQQGIEFYHMLKTGSAWPYDGGHFMGRKMPIVFTAIMLDNPEMKQLLQSTPPSKFAEDGSIYVGNNGVPLWGIGGSGAGGEGQYWAFMANNNQGKVQRDPYGFIDGTGALSPSGGYQLCCNNKAYKGATLVAMLLPGGRAIWNYEPVFNYVDRFVTFGSWALPDPCSLNKPTTFTGTCVPGAPRFPQYHGANKDAGYYSSSYLDAFWAAYRTRSGMPPVYVPPTNGAIVPPATTVTPVATTTTPVVPPSTPTSGLTATSGWTACGAENTRCVFSGTRQVRYGAGTTFVTKTFTDGVLCSNANFTDPAPRTIKSCAFQATVAVPAPAVLPTLTLTPAQTSILSGASTNLTWNAQNATSCQASGGWTGTKSTSGSQSTGPLTSTQTYTLTCTGLGGSVTQSASVGVTSTPLPPAPTPTTTPITTTYKIGDRIEVTKNVNVRRSGLIADSTLIGVNPVGSVGTITAGPTQSVDRFGTIVWFNVNFDSGFDGWVGADNYKLVAPVVVPPAPTLTLSTANTNVANGSSTTLTWSSTNATSCTASGAWSGTKNTSSTQSTGALTTAGTQTFTLTCTGTGGTVSRNVSVTVAAPIIVTPTPTDDDGDTIPDTTDNCPTVANTNQLNFDGDSRGDACDSDDDNDGISDTNEKAGCILNASATCGQVVTPTPTPTTTVSNRVTTTDTLRVRSTPNGTILGTQPMGAVGTIDTTRQQTINGTVWVYVNFDSGLDGYVSQAYLSGASVTDATQTLINSLLAQLVILQAALAALLAQ